MAADSTTTGLAWSAATLRDPHARADKAARVEAMFDAIAPTYERVNSIASFGQDTRWRRRAIAAAEIRSDDIALDLCCGTGDMVRALAAADPAPRRIIGIDFAARMLACGHFEANAAPVHLARADALRLPLGDRSIDVVTCAFGVRNFQDLGAGLREIRRVLRPRGRVVILEFALPEIAPLRWGYRLYCEVLLPRIGALISRDRSGAYQYLPQSIRTFERRGSMLQRMTAAGLESVRAMPLHFGGVVIYRAHRQ